MKLYFMPQFRVINSPASKLGLWELELEMEMLFGPQAHLDALVLMVSGRYVIEQLVKRSTKPLTVSLQHQSELQLSHG